MAFKFNPFTGTLDQTGSGGGGSSYIDGEVQNFSALPETLGTPAVDSAYLVREAEGTWLLARKPAGIYIRTANTGVRADDWTHAGAFPDVFNDANFLLYDNADSTKNLAFQLSGITTGTTRTLTVPNSSGTISIDGHTHIASDIVFGQFANNRINWGSPDPIGTDVANIGTFTTLTAATALVLKDGTGSETATFDAQGNLSANRTYDLPDASGTLALTENFAAPPAIGNTTPAAGSFTTLAASGGITSGIGRWYDNGAGGFVASLSGVDKIRMLPSLDYFIFSATMSLTWGSSGVGGVDLIFARDAADTLAQRRAANPQTFRIYNTFTSATNHERGFLKWSSNVFQIGTEKGSGGGTARALEFQTDGVTRMTLGSAGEIGFFGTAAAAQPAAIADATDAATTQARLNDLLAAMRTLGLIDT
jgi:hypothetical protein